MGFADYLSRNPSGAPSSTNEDDEKFVINLIEEMKHAILKQSINSFGSNKPTGNSNQSELKMNEMTSSMLKKTHTQKKTLFAIVNLKVSRFFLTLC